MNLKNTFNDKTGFTGIYRGFVVWNDDPKVRGRIKVFIPGVYSDKYETQPANLPWARPFSPSFGGGSPNPNNEDRHVLNDEVGWCSVPHAGDMKTGSQVFVFFENGDINYPVYFGVAQSQEGWFSEHPNQHCFRSDNIRVRIDENVKDPRSTCKFNSYNTYNSEVSKKNLERDCDKFTWKFNKDEGNIEQLETRLDIEIEATKMNAVNLNIHGNVNMHIDGDWFVEHFGNKYEYQKGDLYIKRDGHTYIEETGHRRNVRNGDITVEHVGNTVINQNGDMLLTRTGSCYKQNDGEVTKIYNDSYKIKVNGNYDEITRNNRIIEVGNGIHLTSADDVDIAVGGHLSLSIDTHLDLTTKNNFEIHSKTGNIILKTDGEFELMDGKRLTGEGFKNLGTRGNVQIVSTFGNINIQCIKNKNLADFCQKSTVMAWNPDFVRQIKENPMMFYDVSPTVNALKGMEFSTDIDTFGDFIQLMKDAQDLYIYDSLPVFLPGKMIVQNPNIVSPKNADDVSWIPTFRDEATDWRSIKDDVMWKLPGRLMGNINIETWAGDINIKAESELGCAGNVNIKAEEKLGTFPGYKIGTINFDANGKEKVYPDPRDLFLDSDFFKKNAGVLELFTHGTDRKKGPVLTECCNEILKQTGYSYDFNNTNYNRFYQVNALNVITKGFTQDLDKSLLKRYYEILQKEHPKLGCSKCIGDYLLGIPMVQGKFYTGMNIVELNGGYHMYGFQRLNPNDHENPRGVFNIEAGDFDKISMGDGHAIATNFMRRDYGSANIGGVTFNLSGDLSFSVGRNQYKSLNLKNPETTIIENYEHIETPYDYQAPQPLKDILIKMKSMYEASPMQYVKVENNEITLEPNRGPRPFEAAKKFKHLEIMPEIKWNEGGHISEYIRKMGEDIIVHEVEDKRTLVDFGFDFERAKDLVTSSPAHLEYNVKENEWFSTKIDRGSDKETHSGGNSRWFQARNFDAPDGLFHVEISADFNAHNFKLTDRSEQWMKSHEYHDQGFVWWDDNYFDSDLVPWFPDSEFDIESTDTDKIWDEANVVRKHHSWSKYGNHIKNDGKHKEYVKPTTKCGKSYKVEKGNEPKVNTVPKLWATKRGAGVRQTKDVIVTANQLVPHCFSLNSANCAKNQNIEVSEVWNAATHIYQKKTVTAAKNLFNEEWYTSDINKNAITYTAAVNTNVMTLHSDHVVLTPDEELDAGLTGDKNEFTLHAGNLMKTNLIGNQDYFNYDPKEDTTSYGDPGKVKWKYDKQYTNNFEISQNGFHKNSFKILNGTETYIPAEGNDPEFAKYLDNEMVISNGGYGDLENIPSTVTYWNPPSGISRIPGFPSNQGVTGTMIYPLSANNYIYMTNGIDDGGVNTEIKEQNAFRFENGTGIMYANNSMEFENGSDNEYGGNFFRVDNQGAANSGLLKNAITLNNDNNFTNLILSDFHTEEKKTWLKSPIISLYSALRINEHADVDHIIESPTGIVKHSGFFFDSTDSTVKTSSTFFDTTNLSIKVTNEDTNVSSLMIKTSNVEFNSTSSLLLKTNKTKINAKELGLISEKYTIDANSLITNATTIKQTGTTTNILGTNITVSARDVRMSKVTATGNFIGHLDGSMRGPAMLGSHLYEVSLLMGNPVSIPTTAAVSAKPQKPVSPTAPIPPTPNDNPNPMSNLDNNVTMESTSLGLISKAKTLINKFIELELSLLDIMNGN